MGGGELGVVMKKREAFFVLGLLGLGLIFLPACQHNRSKIETVELEGNQNNGLPPPTNRRSVNIPPPQWIWIVKEMTVTKSDGVIMGRYIYDLGTDTDGNLRVNAFIEKGRPAGGGELVEEGRLNFSYSGNRVMMTMAGEVTDGFSGTFELDDQKRLKTVVVVDSEDATLLLGRLEYEYEGEAKRVSKIKYSEADDDGVLPAEPDICEWHYSERGYANRVLLHTPLRGAEPAKEADFHFNYEGNGYLRLRETYMDGELRTPIRYENTYDEQGRLKEQKRTAPGVLGGDSVKVLRFTYDNDGNIASRCLRNETDFTFDRCGEFHYERILKLPFLYHLIMDPKREMMEDIETYYVPACIPK